ncbi:hypothetical protein FACS1894153_3420 [Bacteroidia bacterium]|nr:hypothetical protein FACS1894153_3420 [Bacteroidia bacterium]
MNYLDIIILVPTLYFCIRGLFKGAISEFISIIALFAGLFIAAHFSSYLSNYINLDVKYASIIYFLITFTIVVLILFLIGKILKAITSVLGLGWINYLLGFVLGGVKAFLILGTLLFYFNKIDTNNNIVKNEDKQASLLYIPIQNAIEKVFPTLQNCVEKAKTQISDIGKPTESNL